ncbi:hypothetical protein [Bradyrhizobium sp. sGM-13]|uniref:hypothetical protein n=1 Tax=Bradyrhizobium sp. sGM-13 TaxID=2831781 RepID=UPI001BCFDDF0|nr:hypothetical protein [Bradyrhizobium sp. sGM-13]
MKDDLTRRDRPYLRTTKHIPLIQEDALGISPASWLAVVEIETAKGYESGLGKCKPASISTMRDLRGRGDLVRQLILSVS